MKRVRKILMVTFVAAAAVAATVVEAQPTTETSRHRQQPQSLSVWRTSRQDLGTAQSVRLNAHGAAQSQTELRTLMHMGLPLYCGGDRHRYVALTFDDGPGPYTALALRILRRDRAHATFFLVGRNLRAARGLPRAERFLGAVGDHTWTHAFLPGLSLPAMDAQLAKTQTSLAQTTGAPVQLFRPPYGAHTPAIDAEARRLGMLEVLWSVDSRDWAGARWDRIADTVERDARPGSIVLMHENHGQTIRALKFLILPMLRRRGFTPVSVTQLLSLDPPTLTQVRRGLKGCFSRQS